LLRAAVSAGPLESFDREEPSLNQIYVRALEDYAAPIGSAP
jgi:hypothetical protein